MNARRAGFVDGVNRAEIGRGHVPDDHRTKLGRSKRSRQLPLRDIVPATAGRSAPPGGPGKSLPRPMRRWLPPLRKLARSPTNASATESNLRPGVGHADLRGTGRGCACEENHERRDDQEPERPRHEPDCLPHVSRLPSRRATFIRWYHWHGNAAHRHRNKLTIFAPQPRDRHPRSSSPLWRHERTRTTNNGYLPECNERGATSLAGASETGPVIDGVARLRRPYPPRSTRRHK